MLVYWSAHGGWGKCEVKRDSMWRDVELVKQLVGRKGEREKEKGRGEDNIGGSYIKFENSTFILLGCKIPK